MLHHSAFVRFVKRSNSQCSRVETGRLHEILSLSKRHLVSLGRRQCVDCATTNLDWNGGLMDKAFSATEKNAASEASAKQKERNTNASGAT